MKATFLIHINISDVIYNHLGSVDLIYSKKDNCFICEGEEGEAKGRDKFECIYNYLGKLIKERDKDVKNNG